MARIWKIKQNNDENVEKILSGYPLFLRQILSARGFENEIEVQDFLNPTYEQLHSPFLFKEMEKAVTRIWQAIESGEKICIYGDYDADAVTANAVLQQTFRYLGLGVSSYIPDRFTEGYGINLEALDRIKKSGVTLIITVDCGTNSRDAADWALENGVDFIVTDHHEIIGELPRAYALINPKNPYDKYPYHEIVGVGVAFKLACGILSNIEKVKLRVPTHVLGWEKWLLDLVAIGTVADCHSLIGENRVMVKYGLKVLEKTKWIGLSALMSAAQLDFSKTLPDTYTLGFVVAPRLNAAGRLEHADAALNLLLEKDDNKAKELAVILEDINNRRQDQTKRILSEAKEQALQNSHRKFIVVTGEGWNKGVVGLVAGRLAEEFYKPVVVMEKGESESTGSARTAGDFNLLESLKFASEHIHRFGGHKQAAGLTVKNENVELFYQKVLEFAENNLTDEDLIRKLYLDAELIHHDLTVETYKLISSLAPFGVGNPSPKFSVPGLKVYSLKFVGQDGKHLQLKFKSEIGEISGIMFSAPEFAKSLKIGDTVDVAAEIIEDNWNGRNGIKLRVIDIRNHVNISKS